MSKKRKNHGLGAARKPAKVALYTEERVREIEGWLKRVSAYASRAVDLTSRIVEADFHPDNDGFWAVVKYAENVQESVKQLDNLDRRLWNYLSKEAEDDVDSSDMKGMRDILAHQFWSIDPSLLRDVVSREFPTLLTFLGKVKIGNLLDSGRMEPSFTGSEWAELNPSESLVYLWFYPTRPAVCRIRKTNDDKQVQILASEDLHIASFWGVKRTPEGEEVHTKIGGPAEVKGFASG